MTMYQTPPVFADSVGQLLSASDLDSLRHNVGLAEGSTWRWSEAFANLGGVETGWAQGNFGGSTTGTVSTTWDGYLMVKSGMTTLTVEGRTNNVGSSVLSLWINGVNKQSWTPGSTSWTISQSLSGYAVGDVIQIQVKIQDNGLSSGANIFIKDIYGSPLTFATTWPGVPTFAGQYDATKLVQLSNATSWVINRSSIVPRPPLLSMRYGLGAVAGPDRRPIYAVTVGRYYSQQQFRFGFQVADNALPNLHTEVWMNGSLVWDSGTHPQGTSNYDVWLPLTSTTVGNRAEIEIYSNQQATIPRTQMHFSQYTIWTATAMPNDPTIFSTPSTTPASDVLVSDTTLNAYLNNLCTIVSNSKARIDAQPNFFNRVRAQRQAFGRPRDYTDDLQRKRNPPRFWRNGDALVVNGKNVSVGYGGVTVPTNDRGIAWYDYTFTKTQQIIDGDHVNTQVLWLDTVPGVTRGTAYYLTGEVHWAEESLL